MNENDVYFESGHVCFHVSSKDISKLMLVSPSSHQRKDKMSGLDGEDCPEWSHRLFLEAFLVGLRMSSGLKASHPFGFVTFLELCSHAGFGI